MMDHIELSVTCDEEAKEALEAYRDYIMKETLSDSFLYADGLPEEYSLNGHKQEFPSAGWLTEDCGRTAERGKNGKTAAEGSDAGRDAEMGRKPG